MIRHELLITTIRFYITQSEDPYQPFDAVCTLMWESPQVVWIKAMHGIFNRDFLRELIKFCKENKIVTVKATRENGRTLPYVTKRTDTYIEIDITAIPDRN